MRNFSGIVTWYSADRIGGILVWSSNISIIFIVNSYIALVFKTKLLNWTANEESLRRVSGFFSYSHFVVSTVILCTVWERRDVLWVKWVNESWVMSQIWKNKSFGRNNKIKHYFYLICLLASLLPAHARPISDMKSQPGLFVSSISGPAATVTCMPRKMAFPDTLQEPIKTIRQSILLEFPYQKWSAAPRMCILVDARVLNGELM